MTADFKRLGKRGSYRLGRLRAQGVAHSQPPSPFRPRFTRRDHRWPVSVWLLGYLAGVLLIIAGAAIGWWFVPFAAGVLAGLVNWIGRWPTRIALRGQPYGAQARVIAALLGLPAYSAVGVAVTLLVAAAQAVAGYWLGRALTPLPSEY
jgi:hypothetical protein